MTRLGFDGLVSGAKHSNDGLGMRWDFFNVTLSLSLGAGSGGGDGEGEIDGDVLLRRFTFNDA